MLEIVFPHGYSTGISRPFFLQLGERLPGCLCIYGTIDSFQLFGKSSLALTGDIAYGIADKMYDAALSNYLREDCFRPFFQAGNAIHRKKT